MRKKILFGLLFFLPVAVTAQVTINVQLPPAGMIQKDQLWNVVLMNGTNATLDVSLFLNLQDAVTGQSVLSATTRSFLLGKGAKFLSIRDVQPIQYNFGTAGFNSNFLPLGSYVACYTLLSADPKKNGSIADECVRVNIAPLSPPLLNTPLNNSALDVGYPQFSWSPPTPLDMFDNLTYDLAVVEVLSGQSPQEAILYNSPLYSRGYIRTTFESYPTSLPKLDTGKIYAWQVTVKNGLNYAANTEVWSFKLAKQTNEEKVVSNWFILLGSNSQQNGVNIVDEKSLRIKYYSAEAGHETQFRFLDAGGRVITEKKQKVEYGDNYLTFSLNHSFKKGEVYRIEVTNQRNLTQSASFSIK